MVDFTNKTMKILDQAKEFSSKEVGEFKDAQDPNLVKGVFVFENYLARRNDAEESFFSGPIMVEGVCYRLIFYPNGWDDGKGTHISVGMQ